MLYFLFKSLFVVFTLYTLINSITYSLFEFKKQNNYLGGITILLFNIFCFIFSYIVFFNKL